MAEAMMDSDSYSYSYLPPKGTHARPEAGEGKSLTT
jgi:hypothetical protein